MAHHLQTEIEIDAPTAVVWDIVMDLERYQDWNPFIVKAEGVPEVGRRLVNRLQPPGRRGATFRPTVTEVEPERSFEWLGRLGIPGLFDGRHRFELQSTPSGGTVLTHGEQFTGILVPLFRSSLDGPTVAGFEAMNTALKARAEARALNTP